MNKKNKRALLDLTAISAVAFAVFVVAHVLDLFEVFTEWARRHEYLNLDELLIVPVVFGLAFGVYFWRRWRDLNEEVSRREELENQLAHQASHDYLTGLANRGLFVEHLENALARAHRGGEPVTVLFVDLDEFKAVNDEFGHEAGDQLLVEVARRLKMCLRPGDVVARIGGDEFTILLENPSSPDEAAHVAARIVHSFEVLFRLGEQEMRVTASIGTALSSDTGDSASQLLRGADLAMYQAKRAGKARYEVFAGE